MRTFNSIQVARGLAAAMVVAFHMLSIEAKYVEPKFLPSAFAIGPIGVDIFFVISGLVMMLSTENLVPSGGSILEFLRRRLVRIFPIYWFFTLLVLPVYLLAPHLVNSSQGSQVDLIRSFLLLPSDRLPLIAVAWSLVFELWFYLLFAVLLMFPRRYMPAFLAAWTGFLLLCWLFAPADVGPTLRVITSPYALEFIAGCAAYYLFRMYTAATARLSILAGVVALIAAVWAYPSVAETITLVRTIIVGCSVAFVLAGLVGLERFGYFKSLSKLAWTGDISYAVYLSHILVLSVLGRLFAALGVAPSVLVAVAFWVVAIALVVTTGILSHHLIEKPVGRLLKQRRQVAAAA